MRATQAQVIILIIPRRTGFRIVYIRMAPGTHHVEVPQEVQVVRRHDEGLAVQDLQVQELPVPPHGPRDEPGLLVVRQRNLGAAERSSQHLQAISCDHSCAFSDI